MLCPRCGGDATGNVYTCDACWRSLSFRERDTYAFGSPPAPTVPDTSGTPKFSKATYDMVADVLSTVKRDHYEFGAQKELFNALVSTFANKFIADNRRFNASQFTDAAFRDTEPSLSVQSYQVMDEAQFVSYPGRTAPPPNPPSWSEETLQGRPAAYQSLRAYNAADVALSHDRILEEIRRGFGAVRMTRSGAPTPTAAQQDEQE